MPGVIVLGSGLVGSVMAADLAGDGLRVVAADRSEAALARARARAGGRIETLAADLADPVVVRRLVEPFDVVVGALASPLGFRALEAVIEAGRPCCDISFMPEDAWELDELARARGVPALVDCGVAPGMSNLLAARGAASLDRCERVDIVVGGIPRRPEPPFFYKAAFAPHDVIEEYTRPARVVEGGRIVVKDALSDPGFVDLPGVGRLEAAVTDGLRSLTRFLEVPDMRERTLRWPGHYDVIRTLRDAGLFATDPVEVGGVHVRPLDVTSALLAERWRYAPGEEDLTVMRVVAEGVRGGVPARAGWDLLDVHDRASGTSSMARTTGLTCTTFARLLLEGAVPGTGVLPLERLGADAGLVGRVLASLAAKGVNYEPIAPDS